MGLSIGIVGLPNVGKSTLFNALTSTQKADSANYPFCTIEPNKAIVSVPDKRLDFLADMVKSNNKVNATVEFLDIAGLVKGASKGEGLGNKFLSNIRETQAILQVVRCFDNDEIIHVDGCIDPVRDIEIIETELILSDYQSVENRIQGIIKSSRGDKKLIPVVNLFESLMTHLGSGNVAKSFNFPESEICDYYVKDLQLLTNKPFIYCCNVDENQLISDDETINEVKNFATKKNSSVIKVCAKMEEELRELSEEDRDDYLNVYNIMDSGLDQIIKTGYKSLGLISYFTQGPKETRAWTVKNGSYAPNAAGVIHTDFERGFIRAQVISYDDFIKFGGEQKCKDAGLLRTEGKDYQVKDGDIIEFLFNV